MTLKIIQRLVLGGLICTALSCEDQSPTVYRIDDSLKPYLQKFIIEAHSLGINIKEENLILEFGEASEEICGQCTRAENGGQRTVIIDEQSICWDNAHSQTREALVFHELGHCLLDRGHRNDYLPKGDPASIMHSQNEGPYSPCVYDLGGDGSCDKTSRRDYYINELFDPNTPVPEWGK